MVSQACHHVPIAVIVDSFGHPLRMRSAHCNPLPYSITGTMSYLIAYISTAAGETSYVYSRTNFYDGAFRRFEETAFTFLHDDVELRTFRFVVAVAMTTVCIRSDLL